MTGFSSRQWPVVLLILTTLFVASACESSTASSPAPTLAPETTKQAPAASQTPAATKSAPTGAATPGATGSAAAATPTPGATPARANVVFGPGSFNFPKPVAGLSTLSSYKASLSVSFQGTEAGQARQWSKTYAMLVTTKPAARQLTLGLSGQLANLDALYMAEVDGAAYERRGEQSCTGSLVEKGASLSERWEPARLLPSVIGADKAGSEAVNAVAANHYTFDERALGQTGIAQSTGELWVASDGGYLLKYVLTTKGSADYFGEGTQGTLSWDYRLSDLNQPVAIQLPADCPAGMVDAPLLPDAADVEKAPGLLTYTTATSLAAAAAFYQAQLPAAGWQLAPEPITAPTSALLEFTKGEQLLSVIIVTGDGGTTVHIVLGAKP